MWGIEPHLPGNGLIRVLTDTHRGVLNKIVQKLFAIYISLSFSGFSYQQIKMPLGLLGKS